MRRRIKRGEIYYVDLEPVCGSEQGGKRPALIISNDTGNRFSPTVIVAVITSRPLSREHLPTHYLIGDVSGLEKYSTVLLEQLRTIDKKRIVFKMGKVSPEVMRNVEKAITTSLALKVIC